MSLTSKYKFVEEEFLFKQIFGNRLQLNSVKFFNDHLERTDIYIEGEQLVNKRHINKLSEYLILHNSTIDPILTIKIIGAERKEIPLAKYVFIDIFSTQSLMIKRYRLILDKHLYNYEEYMIANCKIGMIETIYPSDSRFNYAYVNENYYTQKHNMIFYKPD